MDDIILKPLHIASQLDEVLGYKPLFSDRRAIVEKCRLVQHNIDKILTVNGRQIIQAKYSKGNIYYFFPNNSEEMYYPIRYALLEFRGNTAIERDWITTVKYKS